MKGDNGIGHIHDPLAGGSFKADYQALLRIQGCCLTLHGRSLHLLGHETTLTNTFQRPPEQESWHPTPQQRLSTKKPKEQF